jgi:hypothetical protein
MRKSYRGEVCKRLDEIVEGDCHVLKRQEKSRLVVLPRIVSTFHSSHLVEQAQNRFLSVCAQLHGLEYRKSAGNGIGLWALTL